MSDDGSKSSALISITDVFGLGSLSKSAITSLQAMASRLYRPIALKKEGNVIIDLNSKSIIDIAKARSEANNILQGPETNALNKIRALDDLETINRLEQQADVITEGVSRVMEKDPVGERTRAASSEWMDLFLGMAERINDADIRRIWAEILAREVTEGQRRMSLHTLDSMRFLEARHAKLFDAYARTFLVFGRCWRDGFDSTFGKHGKTLLGRSDAHNDFRSLAEMGFVEMLPGNKPEKGRPSLLNFHRFAVRIEPLNQTFNIQEVRPTMRGEELMRVLLDLTDDKEDISVGKFAKNRDLSYSMLDPNRQAMVLRRWFNYLFNEAFRIEIGVFRPGQSFLNCDYQFVWQERGLVPVEGVMVASDAIVPAEISYLFE